MKGEVFKNINQDHIQRVKGFLKAGACDGACFSMDCPFNSDYSEIFNHISKTYNPVCYGELYDSGMDENLKEICKQFLNIFDVTKLDLTE